MALSVTLTHSGGLSHLHCPPTKALLFLLVLVLIRGHPEAAQRRLWHSSFCCICTGMAEYCRNQLYCYAVLIKVCRPCPAEHMAVHRFRKHNPFGPDLRSIFFIMRWALPTDIRSVTPFMVVENR